ncbi:MAG: glycoside hydrolase family 20 zincin-like fold domain-containing protein [Anaerolineae bacterium]
MKLAEAFPFYTTLGNSIVPGPIDHSEAPPPPGATALDNAWCIVVEAANETLRLAADDLHRFLLEAFGVNLSLTDGTVGPREVRLHLKSLYAGSQSMAEAHSITVDANSVTVEGNTAVGVMHGVFHLQDLMREHGGPYLLPGVIERAPIFERRIHRSAVSPFYVEEAAGYDGSPYKLRSLYGYDILFPPWRTDEGLPAYYADHVLLGLARHGFNGIWLRGVLRLLSHTTLYPDGGEYADKALPRIRELCQRAARYGISVYIYLNEPMGFAEDEPFWKEHPDLRGSPTDLDNLRCLCTSHPETLAFCREGMYDLFSRVPELAGAILITASEFPTHCWSHTPALPADKRDDLVAQRKLCPRCAERNPCDIVAEVVTHLNAGLKEANPRAQLLAWNWAWQRYEPDPQPTILAGLPRDVIVLGDFERGAPTQALDRHYDNAEYSLKVIGPSQRFLGIVEHQRSRGLPAYAKLQLGTTHENPTVPYLPVLSAIGEKYRRLRDLGVSGMMTCWNFGNMPSIATEVANAFTWAPQEQTVDAVLRRVAARYVGAAAAPALIEAWRTMHEGIERAYPGSNAFLYTAPLSRGPAFPWTLERLNRPFPPSWLLVPDAHADDMSQWLSIFGAEGVTRCMEALDESWSKAIVRLEAALPLTRGSGRRELERAIGVARMCLIQFRSTANIAEFLLARERYYAATEPHEHQAQKERLVAIARRERANAAQALPLVDADPRLGFHGEAFGYLFNRPLIEQKLGELDDIIKSLSGDGRRRG